MIAIRRKRHTENSMNQQGPKNMDSFWINSFLQVLQYAPLFWVTIYKGKEHYKYRISTNNFHKFQLQKSNNCHEGTVAVITKVSTKNVCFRIPQEKWYVYPAWLFLYIQAIILPVILLCVIAVKILMKKEIKQYLFGISVHSVHA